MNNPENFSLKKDILIINDSSNNLRKLTIFLLKQGYRVRSEQIWQYYPSNRLCRRPTQDCRAISAILS
jgi:hypothetical protein